MAGQIIIVSGPSGSGKSTTCRTFARAARAPYLMFGIDQLIGTMFPAKFTMHGERSREGIFVTPLDSERPDGRVRMAFGDFGWTAVTTMHAMVAQASRAGLNIIVDHLMFEDPPILQDCVSALDGLPVLFVGLSADVATVLDRVGARKIEVPPDLRASFGDSAAARIATNIERLMPWYHEAIGKNGIFDLAIDTGGRSPEEVCEAIRTRLNDGPGTAFAALRDKFTDAVPAAEQP